MNDKFKDYLGDAVYVDFDGYQIRLTTSNGIHETNEIFLEPEVVNKLIRYINIIKEMVGKNEPL